MQYKIKLDLPEKGEVNLSDVSERSYSIPATLLIPRSWDGFFWTIISESAPFSFGDNNKSLVDANSFRIHIEECFPCGEPEDWDRESEMVILDCGEEIDYKEFHNLKENLRKIPEGVYINMEE